MFQVYILFHIFCFIGYNIIPPVNIKQNEAFVKAFAEFLFGWVTAGCGMWFYNSRGNCKIGGWDLAGKRKIRTFAPSIVSGPLADLRAGDRHKRR